MKMKEQQVTELDEQAVILKKIDPQQESIIEKRKALVAERYKSFLPLCYALMKFISLFNKKY